MLPNQRCTALVFASVYHMFWSHSTCLQSRPWLGVSLRPSFAVTTLLRMRGNGNLQGYSRYNAGPVQLLFG